MNIKYELYKVILEELFSNGKITTTQKENITDMISGNTPEELVNEIMYNLRHGK